VIFVTAVILATLGQTTRLPCQVDISATHDTVVINLSLSLPVVVVE